MRRSLAAQASRDTQKTRLTPIVAMVARDGGARANVIGSRKTTSLFRALQHHIDPKATLMTDDWHPYERIGKEFADHDSVTHSKKEYVRGKVHVNSVEGFFSLFKRGITGSFHHVSEKHLPRYCSEFAFRWTYKLDDDKMRANILMGNGLRRTPLRLSELTGGYDGGSNATDVATG